MTKKEIKQLNRFQVCQLPGPAEGAYAPETEAIGGADFGTRAEAEHFIGVFPGKGYGYIYDTAESRPVLIFSWQRTERAN